MVLVFEMGTTSITAVFMSWSSDFRRCSRDGLGDGFGSGQFLNFFVDIQICFLCYPSWWYKDPWCFLE